MIAWLVRKWKLRKLKIAWKKLHKASKSEQKLVSFEELRQLRKNMKPHAYVFDGDGWVKASDKLTNLPQTANNNGMGFIPTIKPFMDIYLSSLDDAETEYFNLALLKSKLTLEDSDTIKQQMAKLNLLNQYFPTDDYSARIKLKTILYSASLSIDGLHEKSDKTVGSAEENSTKAQDPGEAFVSQDIFVKLDKIVQHVVSYKLSRADRFWNKDHYEPCMHIQSHQIVTEDVELALRILDLNLAPVEV